MNVTGDLTLLYQYSLNLFVLDAPGKPQAGPLVDLRWVPAGPSNNFMRQRAADAGAPPVHHDIAGIGHVVVAETRGGPTGDVDPEHVIREGW